MHIPPPARVALARLPTPLVRLPRLSAEVGRELWCKRDDLTGAALSGNKVRKLEFLLGEAETRGCDTLITCGAVTSNHCRATAAAAAQRGLACHVVLRGAEPPRPDGNLLLMRLLGATTRFITAEAWLERDRILADEAARLTADGRTPYVSPRGGEQCHRRRRVSRGGGRAPPSGRRRGTSGSIASSTAVGSGGTTAGLALGFSGTTTDVVGVAVCDDRAYFDNVIARIHEALAAAGHARPGRPAWTILEGYKGQGYAETTREELAFLAHVARTDGLILDPVYTGKAFRALYDEAKAGRMSGDGVSVFLHTGGIFGLFSYAEPLAAAMPEASSVRPR